MIDDGKFQCCGKDVTVKRDAVRISVAIDHVTNELLAVLCIRCYAKSILWAAEGYRRTIIEGKSLDTGT